MRINLFQGTLAGFEIKSAEGLKHIDYRFVTQKMLRMVVSATGHIYMRFPHISETVCICAALESPGHLLVLRSSQSNVRLPQQLANLMEIMPFLVA